MRRALYLLPALMVNLLLLIDWGGSSSVEPTRPLPDAGTLPDSALDAATDSPLEPDSIVADASRPFS